MKKAHFVSKIKTACSVSVFNYIRKAGEMEGRSCLELNVVEAITRVVLEGPAVATTEGYNLSKEALSK